MKKSVCNRGEFKTLRRHSFRKAVVNAKQSKTHCWQHEGESTVRALLQGLVIISLLCFSISTFASDYAEKKYNLDIQQQSVAKALTQLSEQTDVQVFFPYNLTKGKTANAIKGEFTVLTALDRMLKGSGLHGGISKQGVLTIFEGELEDDEISRGEKNMKNRKHLLASTVAFFVGGSGLAVGQEGISEKKSGWILEEVTVTAQKREQNLQDVPIAISALTDDALLARGISNGFDLQFSVPGLVVGTTVFGPTKATIRGVGTANLFPGGDPGVPVHSDGHYLQSTAYLMRDFLDIDRVEVLRGPQGTLYGRNAIGGNINIITKRPSDELEGLLGVDIGNYDKRLLQAVVSGPLSENLRARLAVSDEVRDGYLDNVSKTGEQDLENSDYTSTRVSLDYDVNEDIQIRLGGYHYIDKGNGVVLQLISDTPTASNFGLINRYELNNAGPNVTLQDARKVSIGTPDIDQKNRASGGSVDVDWDLGSTVFKSLSSYTKDEINTFIDISGSEVVYAIEKDESSYEVFTQEFQLLSNNDSAMQWILGLFYYDGKSGLFQPIEFENFFIEDGPVSVFVSGPTEVNAESIGVFAQTDYSVTDKLQIVAGLRYNRDKKSMFSTQFSPDFGIVNADGGPVVLTDDEDVWTKISGKLGVNYFLDEDVMIYASYSTGYKAGGFNMQQAEPYDPEEVAAFELGVKGAWLDQRLQASASTFYYDYKDKQELQRDGLILELLNAASATTIGAEVEIKANPVSTLLVDFSTAYLKAEYDEFNTEDLVNAGLGVQDLSGNRLPNSPELKVNLGIQYGWSLDNYGELTARVDAAWVDKQYTAPFNRERDLIDSYTRTNAQLMWDSVDGAWQAAAYVNNLEDKVDLSNRFDGGPLYFFPEIVQHLPPRTYGLRVTRHF